MSVQSRKSLRTFAFQQTNSRYELRCFSFIRFNEPGFEVSASLVCYRSVTIVKSSPIYVLWYADVCLQKKYTAHDTFCEVHLIRLTKKRYCEINNCQDNYSNDRRYIENVIVYQSEIIHTLCCASISGLTRVVSEDLNKQLVSSLLELVNDGVVKGVLVLLKPSGDVVTDLFRGMTVFYKIAVSRLL